MKIKTDFVTNSSSTSFLVAFPKIIETKEELLEFMSDWFAEQIFSLKENPIEIKFNSECINKITDDVFNGSPDFAPLYNNKQKKLSWEEIDKNHHIYSKPENFLKSRIRDENIIKLDADGRVSLRHPYFELLCAESDLTEYFKSTEPIYKFIKYNMGKFLYYFDFSDDYEIGRTLETGDAFKKLEFIRVNHH